MYFRGYPGNSGITNEGIRHLRNCQLHKLAVLYLGDNKIGTQGCKMLSGIRWDSLTKLSISNNQVTDTGALHLSKGKYPLLQ